MRQLLFVVASAVLFALSFPPVGLGILVFVAPVPLLWAMRRVVSAREAGWLGFVFGILAFGITLWWLSAAGLHAWFATALMMGMWGTLFGLGLYTARYWSPWRWWIVAVGAWAAWELLRVRLPFGGLSFGLLGHGVGSLSWPRGAAQWVGTSGWSVIAVGFAAGLVLMFDEEADRRPLEVVAAVVFALTLLGAIFMPSAQGGEIRVAVVQGGTPCPVVHCEDEHELIFQRHLDMTTLIESRSVDLIVWGEDSFGGEVNPTFDGEVERAIGSQAGLIGAYVMAAGSRPAALGTFEKFSVTFSPDGQMGAEYLKRHAVPFGEYIPLRRALQFIPRVGAGVDDLAPGDRPGVVSVSVGEATGMVGTLISYESTFDRMMRDTVGAGAQVMVVHHNTASFGERSLSDQMIATLRMSAASLGVDVVVASITGRSTIVRADGSVSRGTDLLTEDILRGSVRFQESRRTVYAVAGDWLQLLAIGIAIIVITATLGGPSRDFRIRPEHRR